MWLVVGPGGGQAPEPLARQILDLGSSQVDHFGSTPQLGSVLPTTGKRRDEQAKSARLEGYRERVATSSRASR